MILTPRVPPQTVEDSLGLAKLVDCAVCAGTGQIHRPQRRDPQVGQGSVGPVIGLRYAAVPVDAVVFDWGGTLAEYGDLDMADMWQMAARHLAPARAEEVCAQLVAVEAASWARVTLDQRSTTLSSLVALASAQLGLDVGQAVLEEAATHHLDSWTPHMRHDPDAVPTLVALRDMGLKLGLLSNTHWPRAFHEHFLERDGLAPFLDVRCYTSELSHTKPHAEAFRAVLSALEVTDPRRAVFVGDRPYDDVFGAQSFGMRAVLRPNLAVPSHDVEPDAVIGGLPELVDLVAGWR